MKRIGLALGGGGVRGLANVAVLELLDRLGVRPSIIAGCSMGAIVGALYAAGLSGKKIRELVDEHTLSRDDSFRDVLQKKAFLLRWVTFFTPELRGGGLVNVDRFLHQFLGPVAEERFEDLLVPLVVVATDFWTGEQVALSSGPVMPAVRASIAVPGIFAPVSHEGRVLVDGGLVNQVPYDLLLGAADVTIAVDVARERLPGKEDVPSLVESILGGLDIMQSESLRRKLKLAEPEILVRPKIRGVELLDFGKAGEVFRQARPAVEELERRLEEMGLTDSGPA